MKKAWIVAGLVVLAVFGRVLIPVPNFSPVTGITMFTTWMYGPVIGLAVSLASMIGSDIILAFRQTYTDFWGFMSFQPIVYLSMALMVGITYLLRKNMVWWKAGGTALTNSLVFFILSNLFVWLDFQGWGMYPKTFEGLIQCYVMAIPFVWPTVLSDLAFTMGLYGLTRKVSVLQPSLA